MAIHYREMRWSDYKQCKDLFYSIFDLCEDKHFKKAWNNRIYASTVAEQDTIIIGFGLVDNENCIQYVAVNPEFRGQQIGSELMTHICKKMKNEPNIWLKTASDCRLKFWYARFGFEEDHTYLSKKKEYIGSCMIRRQRGRRYTNLKSDLVD